MLVLIDQEGASRSANRSASLAAARNMSAEGHWLGCTPTFHELPLPLRD
jgi:hypothetical protein